MASIQLPEEFLSHLEKQLPEHIQLDEFIAACQRPLKKSIRVNTLKISVANFMTIAEENHWQLEPIPWCEEGFWIEASDQSLGNSIEHLAGFFYIQEASSMLPVPALFQNSEEFNTLLDVAAAPGSKTTQIAAKMNNQGLIVANEFSASRIKALHANLTRCGIHNTAITHFDGAVFGEWLPETFDAILLDAPCSGEGTVRKDPAAFENWSLEAIQTIGETQKKLITSAFHALKPDGVMVYSTCTLSQEENQHICHYLKDTFGDAVAFESLDTLFDGASAACTTEGFLHVFPQLFDSEGFFIAKIRKLAPVNSPMKENPPRKFPFQPLGKKNQQDLIQHLKTSFQMSLPENTSLWLRDKDVWLFPSQVMPLLDEIRFERIGVKIAQTFNKGFKWQHEAITALNQGHQASAIEVTKDHAVDWYMGKDIRPEKSQSKGDVLVTYQKQVIGLGKWVNGRIKNNLPRELVRDHLTRD